MQWPLSSVRESQIQARRAALLPIGVLGLFVVVGIGLGGFKAIEATGAFTVERVEVAGAGGVAGAVRKAAYAATGSTSLLSVNPAAVALAISSVPRVKAAYVDRSFPNTLTIRVVPERAVAIAPTGGDRVVLAASGRVLGPVTDGTRGLPLVAAAPSDIPGEGGTVVAPAVLAELALASLHNKTMRFTAIGFEQDGLVGRTANGAEIRVGDGDQLAIKLKVARSVLRRSTGEVQYIDVTVPTAPVLRQAVADPLTANAPAAMITALSTDASGLGGFVAGATPAESIRTVFG